jgi:hypothetical protein
VKPCQIPKAATHHPIKHAEGSLLGVGRVTAHAVNQLGKPSAGAEEPKAHLRVWELPDCIQKVAGFGRSFNRVLEDEIVVANGPAQKFEVPRNFAGAVWSAKEGVGEVHVEPGNVDGADGHEDTFAQVEVQANGSGSALH